MIKNKFFLLSLVTLFVTSFSGCSYKEEAKKIDLNKTERVELPSSEPAKIKIGLVPEEDIRKMAVRYQALADYLTAKINRKVILVFLDNYGEVCDKFIYKQLDAAFFGSFSYALTHVKAGVEPIARPDYNGTSTYRGLIVVREDGSIKNVSDMRGKRLALVHEATYAGYLYPRYYFKRHGVDDLERYFSKVLFAGSHDKAIFALLRSDVDVATPKDLIYRRIIKENPDLEGRLAVLSASAPVPSNALCVSKDLEPALKKKLKSILLNLNNDRGAKEALESLGATRFVETEDADYRDLYGIIDALGIDLNIYPYYERPDIGFDIEKEGYAKEAK